jgi:hypothetical protein
MRKLSFVLILALLLNSISFGEIFTFEAGILKEPTTKVGTYFYEEVSFISGKPIEMKGTVVVPTLPEDSDNFSITYTYNISDPITQSELSRKVTYDVAVVNELETNQSVYSYTLNKLDESISIDSKEYTLASYDVGTAIKTMTYDHAPAVDFYQGFFDLRRKYFINGDQITNEGEVTINTTSSTMVGYDHFWGKADTNILTMVIESKYPNPDYNEEDSTSKEFINWGATVDIKLSTIDSRDFYYQITDPQTISFRGGYYEKDQSENVVQYTYTMPSFDEEGKLLTGEYETGEVNLTGGLKTQIKSLPISKFKDIGGHWAQSNIELLTSLNMFTNESYFKPDIPITRIEFARAIANAMEEFTPATRAEIIKRAREEQIYEDIDYTHPYYDYIAYLKEKGIMTGEGGFFHPQRNITRQEATAILIRALGVASMAPNPPYETVFHDDKAIQNWAKDYIYTAYELGIVKGDTYGYFRPNSYITKAESSSLFMNYITHVKDRIKEDYREKLINRY